MTPLNTFNNVMFGFAGPSRSPRLYLIDLSMARQWRTTDGEHRPNRLKSAWVIYH